MALPGELRLQELFDESGRRLLRYLAARLRDGTEADDLAQEAYLRLLRMDNAMLIRDPRSFALRVATNVATEWGRLSAIGASTSGRKRWRNGNPIEPARSSRPSIFSS